MKRTLFVTSNRLGDAVLTTGVLKYLIEQEPEIPVTVVCGTIPGSIFEDFDGVDQVIAITKRKRSLHWWDAVKATRFHYWHRIVDFRGSPFSFMPARHRHIWRGGKADIHKVVANAAMIGVDHPLPATITPSDMHCQTARKLLNLDNDRRPILALGPTANFPGKQWHHENYLTLGKLLTEEGGLLAGARIAIFGAPGEEAQAQPVIKGLPENQVIDLVGKTTPMEAATIQSFASLFVGNDSGLMHSAVAVGTPSVGLFGIGQPAVYGPWGDQNLLLMGTPLGLEISPAPNTENHPLPVSDVLARLKDKYGMSLLKQN
jgi:lipopolysaccharide heptosyltransferase III